MVPLNPSSLPHHWINYISERTEKVKKYARLPDSIGNNDCWWHSRYLYLTFTGNWIAWVLDIMKIGHIPQGTNLIAFLNIKSSQHFQEVDIWILTRILFSILLLCTRNYYNFLYQTSLSFPCHFACLRHDMVHSSKTTLDENMTSIPREWMLHWITNKPLLSPCIVNWPQPTQGCRFKE